MSIKIIIATNVHQDDDDGGQGGGTDPHLAFGSDGTLPISILAEFVPENTALDSRILLCPFAQVWGLGQAYRVIGL